MPSASPLSVSVIVPTYSRPDAIAQCIAAIQEQDYPLGALELVVVDDSSPLPVQVGSDPVFPVRVVRTPSNSGPAAARNLGIQAAGGDLLAFTDDDCRPDPDWVAVIADHVRREPESLVGGRTVNALAGNPFAQASQDLVSYLYTAFQRTRTLQPFFTSNNLAGRKDHFLALGGFDDSFRFSAGEDRDLSERWASQIGPLRYAEAATVQHYHSLDLPQFLRQHFYYGRGATHLSRLRSLRGHARPKPESFAFYFRMLAHPFPNRPPLKGLQLSILIALAQVCGVGGMLAELIGPGNEVRRSP